ncbi:hypothetical protein C8R48DRAFT_750083 [Suillus tomentosus]|nr:hypothetical protein C8R48DRAFT_750083 [Suillus tomentosus]
MASINPAPAASAQLPSEFKTEYHPRSGHPTLFQPFDEFRTSSEVQHNAPIIDDEPWHPFRSRGDFEFSEIAIEAALNKSQINSLLSLITRISEVPVTYKKDEQVYEVHARPIWDWALDLLDNPLLAPQFVWDACRVYKRNDTEFEHFFDEPWTGDRWWDIQSSLPDVDGAVPFGFVLYADKTKLSSHGTVKGYPVMAFGGGRVVGWLPIVPEDAGEEGKLGYTMLKHVVWHESFFKLLELAAQYSKTGYSHKCHNNIVCMMSLIHGRNGKCPCPVCLVPLAELHDLSKTYPLRSMEEAKEALRVYRHSKAQGEELLKILGLRPVENVFWIISISNFPRWRNLNHFKSVINVSFTDGNKYQDLSKQAFYAGLNILTSRASQEGHQLLCVISTYLQLDSLISLNVHTEGTLAAIEAELLVFDTELKAYVTCVESSDIEKLKLDWDFPKTHLWKHVVRDIRHKGAAHNYNTRPNEKLHGPLKDTYHYRTNRKDVAAQILHVDHHKFSLMLLRERVDMVDEHNRLQVLGDDLPDEDVDVTFNGHVKMGAPIQHPSSILDLENRSSVDRAFQAFWRKFTEFINRSLPAYGHQLTNWITFPADYQIHEHRYLKVNYELMVDWKQATDHLWCNPQFHGLPWFDHALIQLTVDETIFVCLIFLFRCCISNLGSFEFALIQLYTARINSARRTDRFFKLTRVKAVPRASSIFVPLKSFIRGALLVPDPEYQDEYLVVDHIDSDMFLRMKAQVPQ